MLDVIAEILGLIAHGTGRFILYAVTGGQFKPELTNQRGDSGVTHKLRGALCTFIGIIFWSSVLVAVAWVVAK